MGIELYNKTRKIKEIPKYNYNGKFKLGPGKSYGISDYMVPFYKPFERIGIIIRNNITEVGSDPVEPEVKKVLEEFNENKGADVKSAPDKKEDKIQETSSNEKIEGSDKVKKYSNEEIESMNIDEMKAVLDSFGVDYSKFSNRRRNFEDAIKEAQKSKFYR